MPWDHELCAAFYVDPPDEPEPAGWLDEQLHRLGVEGVSRHRVRIGSAAGPRIDEDEVSGHWAGLGVEVRDLHVTFFRALTLVYSAEQVTSAQLELGDAGSRQRLADAFEQACEHLRPRAAFAVDLWHPDVEELVAGHSGPVLALDPSSLLDTDADLLYLSGSWFDGLDDLDDRTERYDRRAVPDGVLLSQARVGDRP